MWSSSWITSRPRPLARRIEAYQGDTFALELTVTNPDGTPFDLTGATASMELRRVTDDNTATPAAIATPLWFDRQQGLVTMQIDRTITENLSGEYRYDVQLQSTGLYQTVIAGRIAFARQTTTT